MADGIWKGVYPQVIGHCEEILLIMFFDRSTLSMSKGRDNEIKNWNKKKKIMEIVAPNVISSQPTATPLLLPIKTT